jgi:hypothetical protein
MHDMHSQLEKEHHVLFLLGQISTKLTQARDHLSSAHSMSRMDMFGGGTLSSMQKRNYLERAESAISQVRMLQAQLSQTAPHLSDLGPLNIASGSIWGDVIFDNIFSDMAMHEKILESQVQIDNAGNKSGNLIRRHEEKEKELRAGLKEAEMRVQEARAALQRVREAAFRRIAAGEELSGGGNAEGVPEEAPPAYAASAADAAAPAYSA